MTQTTEKAKGKKDDDDDDEGSLAQKAKMKADADKVKASKSHGMLPFECSTHAMTQLPRLCPCVCSASQAEEVSLLHRSHTMILILSVARWMPATRNKGGVRGGAD